MRRGLRAQGARHRRRHARKRGKHGCARRNRRFRWVHIRGGRQKYKRHAAHNGLHSSLHRHRQRHQIRRQERRPHMVCAVPYRRELGHEHRAGNCRAYRHHRRTGICDSTRFHNGGLRCRCLWRRPQYSPDSRFLRRVRDLHRFCKGLQTRPLRYGRYNSQDR